ncbi:MAG: hypothetical protein CMK59_15275 [Proteobacteria bacterium]|nr:hypothetical protein [Pseudomonadota bacterium]
MFYFLFIVNLCSIALGSSTLSFLQLEGIGFDSADRADLHGVILNGMEQANLHRKDPIRLKKQSPMDPVRSCPEGCEQGWLHRWGVDYVLSVQSSKTGNMFYLKLRLFSSSGLIDSKTIQAFSVEELHQKALVETEALLSMPINLALHNVDRGLLEQMPPRDISVRATGECGSSNVNACLVQGWAALTDEMNVNSALGYYRQACAQGSTEGCRFLGWIHSEMFDENHNPQAQQYYLQACQQGDGWSCFALGVLIENTAHSFQDKHRAEQVYQKGCALQEKMACFNLVVLYTKEQSLSPGDEQMHRLYQQTCSAGFQQSCLQLKKISQ